jgi:hypothetical protein
MMFNQLILPETADKNDAIIKPPATVQYIRVFKVHDYFP